MSFTSNVYPGQFLGYIYEYKIGDYGVFLKHDKWYASWSGKVIIDKSTSPPTISIRNALTEYQPKVNDEVYARITKVMKSQAICEIFANKTKTIRSVQGVIKHENVKNEYKEFDIFDCFVPGDIILGNIIAIDQSNYIYLSTAEVNHGVVFAKSQISDNLMMPVSKEQMECWETHTREMRKVARPEIPL